MFNQNQLHNLEASAPTVPAPKSAEGDKANVDNTDIYYMPENFQKNNEVAGKNTNIKGVWVLAITVFLLIALGAGLFIYWQQPAFLAGMLGGSAPAVNVSPLPVTETPATNSLEPASPAVSETSPRELYLAFRSELAQATTVDTYMAVYAKYATAERYAALAEQKTKLESDPATGDVLTALRGAGLPALDGTENITEATAEGRSTLTISKTNGRETGTVIFVSEGAQWRLSEESWQNSASTGSTTGNEQAADDDSDGLSNLEEAVLGTNAKASDSDSDGFGDLEELNNGYNPAGAGKLAEDKNLATYLNTTFNFSLLYPAEWERTIATTDDSIILTAADKQFIQVLIQPNSDREDIMSWYKRTFSVETIPQTQLFSSADWDGVRTPDGLTAYLTNKDKSYIFVVTYNVGTTKFLNYRNIFETVLRSLKLAA